MSYKSSAYAIRTEESGGIICYFVSFKDGQGVFHETEVSQSMYLEFRGFIRKEHNLRQSDWRHKEFSDLTDETLNRRARHTPKSVEETILDMERSETLQKAIAELPDIQRWRFILYFEYELNFREIGEMENCSANAIKSSVDIAKAKVIKKLEV